MILTPTEVLAGKERGQVEFACDTGKKVKVPMSATEAIWFVDQIDKPLSVHFTPAESDV